MTSVFMRMARPGKARTLVGLVPLFLGGVRLARGVERESDTRVGFPLLDMKSWSVKCRCRTNLTSAPDRDEVLVWFAPRFPPDGPRYPWL